LYSVFEKASGASGDWSNSSAKSAEAERFTTAFSNTSMAAFSEQPKVERIACRTKSASEASAEISTASSSWPGKKTTEQHQRLNNKQLCN